jgi:hypothetical protein
MHCRLPYRRRRPQGIPSSVLPQAWLSTPPADVAPVRGLGVGGFATCPDTTVIYFTVTGKTNYTIRRFAAILGSSASVLVCSLEERATPFCISKLSARRIAGTDSDGSCDAIDESVAGSCLQGGLRNDVSLPTKIHPQRKGKP